MIIERSLIRYIERALKIGFPREKIEWSLFEVGWPLRAIRRSYRVAYLTYILRRGYRSIRAGGMTAIYTITNYRALPRYCAGVLRAYTAFLQRGFEEDIHTTKHDYLAMKMRVKKRYEKLTRPSSLFETSPIPHPFHQPIINSKSFLQTHHRMSKDQRTSPHNSPASDMARNASSRSGAAPIASQASEHTPLYSRHHSTKTALQRYTGIATSWIQSVARTFMAEWSRALRTGSRKLHATERNLTYATTSRLAIIRNTASALENNIKEYTAALYTSERAIEHTFKERFGTTGEEILGFTGFLVSNTIRGLEEFLYDIVHILIVRPYFAIKNFVMKLMPHRAIALPSLRPHHVSRGFEYHGVSLPGHIRGIDIIELSSRMFRTRRMRTFLTVLGISIGIGTILFLVSLGYGLQNIIFERIATTESLLTLDVTAGEKEIISLDRSAIERMAALPEVIEVSPLASINGQVSIGDLSANTQIRGINTSYFNLGGIRPSRGRIFEEGERDKVVVSLAVMRLFNITNPEDIIGKQAQFNLLFTNEEIGDTEVTRLTTTYEIVGILEDTETSYVYLPLASLEQFNIATFSQVKIKMANEQNAEAIRSEIIGMGFFVSAVSDILDQATKIFQAIQIVLAVFGLVALIVSAIGMFNTMTIALLERTQEIGIMKALGATPRDIWFMFLSESVIMGFLGGVGGILTGIIGAEIFNIGIGLLANAVGASSTDLFQRPLWFIITIAVFSTLIGFITGLWPAHRASKLNTLAALRYK